MSATVSMLDGLLDAAVALRSGGKALGKAADKAGDVQGVFVEKIEKPLCSGTWWSGVGQHEAKVVIGVNTTAMGTAKVRLGEASAAAYALATLLERASRWWGEIYATLHNGNYTWTEDGTVSGKDTVTADCRVWTPEAMTRNLKRILSYVDDADEEFAKAMRRITHHDLPVTTTRATPGISDRAYDAYKGAVDDLSGHGPLASLLAKADDAIDPKRERNWQLPGRYHRDNGDGYVVGPDGRRYEIVVPQYSGPDGKLYTHGTGPEDVGWHTVGVVDGDGYLDPLAGPAEYAERVTIGVIGQGIQTYNNVDPGKTASLRLNDDGYPVGMDGSDDSSSQPPDDKKPMNHYGFVRRKDGTLEWSDDVDDEPRNRAEQRDWDRVNGNRSGLSPEEQRNLDSFESRRENADRAGGALDMVNGGLDAAGHANDDRYYHYRVEFQQGPDGQRRAVVTTYQVVQGADGSDTVVPRVAYVGSDGHLHYQDANWEVSKGGEVRSPDPHVYQSNAH